ncbi:NRDE family protein [uncultured Rhodospira sp.]|uniref:NRDE family protein n=1 Tax=uncultured Rhodospira sp. TaxID=1936189 RepID=UPI002631A8FE|nr:NRDE family protein [uncultured Rhodospira sp.]
MCTVIVLRRSGHPWPLILAGNRDEMRDRPWTGPGRHWPDRPEVVAGRDDLAGGSWLGLNDHGVVAVILNRPGTLGPQAGKRSRGELVLEALDHADAVAAAEALADLNPDAYRPFNMVLADNRDTLWLRHAGPRPVEARALDDGLWMISAADANDETDPRIRANLPRVRAAPVPDPPDPESWDAWTAMQGLGADPDAPAPNAGMCFELDSGFATVNAAQIALPAPAVDGPAPILRFAPGPPDRTPFAAVDLDLGGTVGRPGC